MSVKLEKKKRTKAATTLMSIKEVLGKDMVTEVSNFLKNKLHS